jgi:hypothetical protein
MDTQTMIIIVVVLIIILYVWYDYMEKKRIQRVLNNTMVFVKDIISKKDKKEGMLPKLTHEDSIDLDQHRKFGLQWEQKQIDGIMANNPDEQYAHNKYREQFHKYGRLSAMPQFSEPLEVAPRSALGTAMFSELKTGKSYKSPKHGLQLDFNSLNDEDIK